MVSLAASTRVVVMDCGSVASASDWMSGISCLSGKYLRRTRFSYVKSWSSGNPECRCFVRPKAAVSTTLPDAWVASEEATSIAAAGEAMALARAALLAAREASRLSECDIGLEEVFLKTDSTSLSPEAERLEAMIEKERRVELAAVEEEPLKEEVEEQTKKVQQTRPAVDVVVTSKRRNQRLLSRAKAMEKKKQEAAATLQRGLTGVSSIKGGRQNKDGYCPHIIRRGRMSAAEELQAIRGIQDLFKMETTKESLKQQLGRDPTFKEWADGLNIDTAQLERQLSVVRRSKEMMISSNLGLVIKVARRFSMKGTNVEDLIQEGIEGLLRGVEKFDTTRGFRLSTYVLWWIELAVRRAAVKRGILCEVPMHLFDMHTRVIKMRAQIFEERGEHPTDEEVAKLIGTSPARVAIAANLMKPARSLDANVPGYDGVTYLEILEDPSVESSLMVAERELLKKQLDRVLSCLKPRERQILRLRHGIEDGRIRTLEELGHTFHLSRERVRQIEKKALRRIQESGGKDVLASFAASFAGKCEL